MPSTDPVASLLPQLALVDAEGAFALLRDAIQAHPQDPRLLLLLGGHHASKGNMDEAETAYLGALELGPQFAIARFQLGLLQCATGRSAVALETWAPLESLVEDHPLRLFSRGLICAAQDQIEAAIAFLERGLVHNQDNPPLNQDMTKVIGRLREVQGKTNSSLPPEGPSQEGGREGHFLLSIYKHPR